MNVPAGGLDERTSLRREVQRLAIPAIGSSLLQTLVFSVDRAMLGHHSATSLAGMQIAGPLEWSITSIFLAFEVGTIARVGRHVGAGDRARARRAALLSLAISVAAGLFLALLAPLLLPGLGRVSPGASREVVAAARSYLGWTLSASPAIFVLATATAVLQAGGDTRTPLIIGVVVNLIHVALNRVLILGAFGIPAMGMAGAGISTSINFTLAAALSVAALLRRDRPVSLRRGAAAEGGRGEYGDEARELGHVAAPALLERILYHAGYLGYVMIIGRLGDAPMAANQSLISIESICFLSADGFGVAGAALVAQKLGAARPREAVRAAAISARYAVIALTALGITAVAARGLLLPLFSNDREVLAIGAATIPVLALAQPFMAAGIVLAQSLRGAGRTRAVLGVSAVSALVVRLVCTWTFAIELRLGLTGIWLGSTADWVVRSALLGWIGWREARQAGATKIAAASPADG